MHVWKLNIDRKQTQLPFLPEELVANKWTKYIVIILYILSHCGVCAPESSLCDIMSLSSVWRCVVSAAVHWQQRQLDKEERHICRSVLANNSVKGATVPLSSPCIFHHALPFLYYLASPSSLNFHVVRADMAFLSLAHKALWCSVYKSWSMAVLVCQCVLVCVCSICVLCSCVSIHVDIGCAMLPRSPVFRLLIHSHHTECDPRAPQARAYGKSHWQHPNYKIVKTPCIGRSS